MRSEMQRSEPPASMLAAASPVAGSPQAAPVQLQDPLAELRDIHLPDPVADWPPAPGWWFVAVLTAALALLIVQRLVRHWRGNRYRREAIRELNALFNQCRSDGDQRRYIAGCAQLLKRVAMVSYPRARVAALSGEEWVAFLDRTCGAGDDFSMGAGQVLIEGPYQPQPSVEMAELHRIAIAWLKRHSTRTRERERPTFKWSPAILRRRVQAAR